MILKLNFSKDLFWFIQIIFQIETYTCDVMDFKWRFHSFIHSFKQIFEFKGKTIETNLIYKNLKISSNILILITIFIFIPMLYWNSYFHETGKNSNLALHCHYFCCWIEILLDEKSLWKQFTAFECVNI